jgi:PleD family two-component response regulator
MDGWTFPFVSFIIISRMLKNRGKGSMNETILLIEDNESIIMGLEYLLTEEQYTFLAAKTKKEARFEALVQVALKIKESNAKQ